MTEKAAAKELIRKAIECLQGGRLLEAERFGRQALERNAHALPASSVLGLVLNARGEYREAARVFRGLIEKEPEHAAHWINLGTALRSAGLLDQALAAYGEATRLGERSANFLFDLGLLHLDRDEYIAAKSVLEQAAALAPRDAEGQYYYAKCCYDCVRNEEALAALSRWQQFEGLTADLLAKLGTLLMQLGESTQAEMALKQALEREPTNVLARIHLVQVLERTNRFDEACERFAALLPDSGDSAAYREDFLAIEGRLAERRGDHATAKLKYRRLLDCARQVHERQGALFSLAKACDALGEYDEAFDSLNQAHESQMAFLELTAPRFMENDRPTLAIANFGCDPHDVAAWQEAGAPPVEQSPIFIVAFPRSGTTLLEQALDAHPLLRSMDEQPFLQNAIDYIQAAGVRYPEQLGLLSEEQCWQARSYYWERVATKIRLDAGQRLVDKNPLNLLRLPAIRRLFPNARIILVARHPCDVILSCYMQHFRAPEFAILCRSLQSLVDGYRRACDFWYRQSALLSPAVHELRYEDFVADFEGRMRACAEFLEVPWHDAMLHPDAQARARGFISTPSYFQVVQPVNTRGVGRWRNYERHFRPALPLLAAYLQRWRYEV